MRDLGSGAGGVRVEGLVSDLLSAGPACRAGHGSPALMDCGLCPIRRLRPFDPAGWLHARVAELEARDARLRQAAADRDELAAAQLASERPGGLAGRAGSRAGGAGGGTSAAARQGLL